MSVCVRHRAPEGGECCGVCVCSVCRRSFIHQYNSLFLLHRIAYCSPLQHPYRTCIDSSRPLQLGQIHHQCVYSHRFLSETLHRSHPLWPISRVERASCPFHLYSCRRSAFTSYSTSTQNSTRSSPQPCPTHPNTTTSSRYASRRRFIPIPRLNALAPLTAAPADRRLWCRKVVSSAAIRRRHVH